MFDLYTDPAKPLKRTKSSQQFKLGKDRGVPPDLEGEHDDYLVELVGDDDMANAKSWPIRRKLIACGILGFDTLVASWGSSVYSAAVSPVAAQFGVGQVVALLGLTLYICGFAVCSLLH